MNQKKDDGSFYCIGIADPATGQDDGFYFTRDQLKKIVDDNELVGLKVWFEHGDNTKQNIGEVIYSWMDKDCGLMLVMKLFHTVLFAKVVINYIKNGILCGVSLGYNAQVQKKDNKTRVISKKIHEVSIVKDPHHPSCQIAVWQSHGMAPAKKQKLK